MPDKDTKTPEELEKMTAAERMSYDIQQRQKGVNPTAKTENVVFTQKISDDAQAGKPGIGKPADPIVTVTTPTKTPEERIEETYRDPLKNLGDYIKDFETKKNTLKEQDEVAKRRAGSLRMIAGISDGLSALANLVGVAGVKGAHASNQTLEGASTPLAQRLEAARLERKGDIKDISDRLDAYKAQRDALRLQKGTTLAELEIKREDAQRAAEAAAAANQFDMLKFIMREEGQDRRTFAKIASDQEIAEGKNQATKEAATIRTNGQEGSGKKKSWDFRVDGKDYSIENADETTVGEVFALLPDSLRYHTKDDGTIDYDRPKYGKATIDPLSGAITRQNPTLEEMKAAIGANITDSDFIKAFNARFGGRTTSISSASRAQQSSPRTAQAALDEIIKQ